MNNIYFKSRTLLTHFLFFAGLFNLSAQQNVVQTFTYTGSMQTFVVPSCVSSITIEAMGAQGASLNPGGTGGLGGYMRGTIPVTAGQVLNIFVGGQNGYNGGALGGVNGNTVFSAPSIGNAANGGGASDVRIGGVALSNRVLVAGGGGGGGSNGTWPGCQTAGPAGNGGSGGGISGNGGTGGSSSACNCTNGGGNGGAGGTALAGGAAGTYNTGGCMQSWAIGSAGSLGNGGAGSTTFHNGTGGGGGGGGGYYGGGAGGSGSDTTPGGGGGGGSSFAGTASNTLTTAGTRTGNGQIVLSYNFNGAGVNASASTNPMCAGSTVTLTASNVLSYTWSAPNSSNATSISVNPTTSTDYTVQGTNSLGCISTAIISLTVSNGAPVLNITNSASTNSICLGTSATLNASGALSYTWTPVVTNGVPFFPQNTTTYTLQGQNGCGITTAMTTITVAPLPINVISSSNTVCALNTITLTSGGANTYTWSTLQQGVTAVTAPTITTVYTVTGQIGPCFGTGSVQVTVNPNPTITISPTSASVCAGGVIGLSINGALTYTWSQTFLSGTNVTVSPVTTTVYAVSGTNQHTCTSSTSQLIIVAPLPVLNVSASRTLVCSGFPSTLTASGNSSSYSWQHGGSTASSTVNPVSTSVYTVTGSNTQCSHTKTVQVAVFSPTFIVTPDTSICEGGSVLLTASGANSYTWFAQNPGSSFLASPTASTTYSVFAMVPSANNYVTCQGMQTVLVDFYDKPLITASAARSQICKGEKVVLSSGGGIAYSWSNNMSGQSVTVTPLSEAQYTVTGTDAFGCVNTASVMVRVSTCPGLSENGENTDGLFLAYPNPNTGSFNLNSEFPIQLQLTNELGQLIKIIELSQSNNYHATVEGLSAGIYVIAGQTDNIKISRKLIVK